MRSLSDSISRLAKMRAQGAAFQGMTFPGAGLEGRLTELTDFGANPGALRGWLHVPAGLEPGAALVVVLHGCTQTAAGYDHGSGWSQLADRHGFALLYPEQQRGNNPNTCFNWFDPADTVRDGGEVLSIRRMIGAAIGRLEIDPARVFVTGLSAGGAMACALLATCPEVFAGGAIVAGLPYGAARSMPEAFDRMRGHGIPGEAALAAAVRGASDHAGPWPRLSVWHGSADATVHPANATAIVGQWRLLHGLDAAPTVTERIAGHPRRVWRNVAGRDVIEEFSITGMGHGTPLKTRGDDSCGAAGPFMIEAGISSSHAIGRFWGLLDDTVSQADLAPPPLTGPKGVQETIEEALRAAGLMR